MSKTKKKLLIDLDTVAYRTASMFQNNYVVKDKEGNEIGKCVSQKAFIEEKQKNGFPDAKKEDYVFERQDSIIELEDGSDVRHAAYHAAKVQIEAFVNQSWVEDFRLVLHKSGNFRNDLWTIWEYKGNRPPKPLLTEDIKEYIGNKYKGKVTFAVNEESDDVVSQLVWQEAKTSKWVPSKHNIVLAGIDKDLLQIPGWHWNFNTKEIKWVDFKTAAYCFWKQVLMGDSSDNIPGIQFIRDVSYDKWGVDKKGKRGDGCGEKTAEKFLAISDDPKKWIEIVADLYQEEYKEAWYDVMQENCALLYLRRKRNEMFDLKKCFKNNNVDIKIPRKKRTKKDASE